MYTRDTIKGHSVAGLSSKSRFQWDATETMAFYRCLVRDQLTKKLIKTADLEQLRRDLGLCGYPPAVNAIVDPKLRYKLTSCFNNTRPYLGNGYPNWCKRWLDDAWDGDISKPTDVSPTSAYQSAPFQTSTPPRLVLEHWVARSPPRPPSFQSMDIDEPSSQWEHMPTESFPKATGRDKARHGVDEEATRIREVEQEAARLGELRKANEKAAEQRKAREEAARVEEYHKASAEAAELRIAREEAAKDEACREAREEAARVEEYHKASAEAAELRMAREHAAKVEARRKASEDLHKAEKEAARVEELRKASEDRREAEEAAAKDRRAREHAVKVEARRKASEDLHIARVEELCKVKEAAAKVEERCKASDERRKASEERHKAREVVGVEELRIVREKEEHRLWPLLQQQSKPQFTRPRYSHVPSEVTVTSSMIAAAQAEVDKIAPTMSPGNSSVSSPKSWTFRSDEIEAARDKLAATEREYQIECLVKNKNLEAYEANVIATAKAKSKLACCRDEYRNLLKQKS